MEGFSTYRTMSVIAKSVVTLSTTNGAAVLLVERDNTTSAVLISSRDLIFSNRFSQLSIEIVV